MKLIDQMELPLAKNAALPFAPTPERADWWFHQMRRAAEGELNFEPLAMREAEAYATPRWLRSTTKPKRNRRW
ncbi:MAG TPA: hypothetical protein VEH27_14045 [Methylomirabilota bacterium]|nr:hypothetical protein [Methylomirabilota bacterium]